jgi:hypothetical protein
MTEIARGGQRKTESEVQPSGLDDLIRVFHMHEDLHDQLAPGDRRYWLLLRLTKLQEVLGYSPYVGELIDSLIEVERGLTAPLFEVTPNGRPKMSLTEQEIQSRAALAMEGLMLGGMKKDAAAREVAKKLGYSSYDPTGARKVAQWRYDLVRAARGTGNYSDEYRMLASLHLEELNQLRRAVKVDGKDARLLAKEQLKAVEWLRRAID